MEKHAYVVARNEALKTTVNRLKNVTVEKQVAEGTISIEFNRKGLEHLQHDFFPNKWTRDAILRNIDSVLKSAEYVSEANYTGENPMIDKFCYYKVTLLNKEWFLNIRKQKNGKAYLYSMTDKIKRE